MSHLEAITLNGKHVKLVPLSMSHLDGLRLAVQDGEIYNLWFTSVPTPANMEAEIERRLKLQQEGAMLPFTIIEQHSGRIVGMTTFCKIDYIYKRLEIGYTWYAKSVQKTPLNTEAKYLLLKHIFETLQYNAIELRTNQYNFNSRRAIERLGAKLDGILRHARVLPNGALCDGYVYSIIQPEWLTVKTNLEYKLNSYT